MALEILLLKLFSTKQHPVLIRYGTTTLIVGIAFSINLCIAAEDSHFPLLLTIPTAFLVGLLFDKCCGIYATVLGLAAFILFARIHNGSIDTHEFVPLAIYLLI